MITRFSQGNIINNRYQIVKFLREGNLTSTYLAQDNFSQQLFIIKQFVFQSPDQKQAEKAKELFQREAESLRNLDHDQIPKFVELFVLNNENLLLIQEYIEGESYYTSVFEKNQKFTEYKVRQFLLDAVNVLIYVHSQQIIHRDISPDNIICREPDKKPVLIDFGCIKQPINKLNSTSATTKISKQGYSPPEVENGKPEFSSDLYSLAVTALVLLTGKLPDALFDPKTNRWNWSEINVSPELQKVLIKMLHFKINARYQNAAEVLAALQLLPRLLSPRIQQPIVKTKKLSHLLFWVILFLVGGGLLIRFTKIMSVFSPRVANITTGYLYKNLTPEQTTINQLINSQQFPLAISMLKQDRQRNPRNGQTLIALENAKIGANKSIVIALVAPFSNDLDKAEEMVRGVAQAQWEVNAAGGINGIPLKVIIVDDSKDQNTVKKIAQEIADDQDILAIIGHFSSDNSIVASEVYQLAKILMISPTATSINLTGKGEYIKRTVVNDAIAGGTLAKYVIETLKKQKMAIFYNSRSNYSKSLKQSLTNQYIIQQGRITYEADFSDPNFKSGATFKEAQKSGANVIMLAADSSTFAQALQVMQVNNRILPLVGGDSLYVKEPILTTGCNDANGMILAVSWNIKNHLNSRYVKTAKKLFNAEVSWRSATSYSALSAIIAALKKNPSSTRQSLQGAISKPDFSAPGADEEAVKFDSGGDRIKPVELVTVNADQCTFEPIK